MPEVSAVDDGYFVGDGLVRWRGFFGQKKIVGRGGQDVVVGLGSDVLVLRGLGDLS